MNYIFHAAFSLALVVMTISCGGNKSGDNPTSDDASSAPVMSGVDIEYSSADALNAPEFDSQAEWGSPLALADGLTHTMAGFPSVEVGAYPDGGKMVYDILLVNQSRDTVTIQSIKLPDSSLEVNWDGSIKYKPGILSGFHLLSDSALTRDDYRFILTYKDNQYPPQTFHLNLRPDVLKLISEREQQANE